MAKHLLTTSFGMPVADDENSLSVGPRGPLALQDHHLIEKLAHFNRERIPERVVHARGSGAYGTFTLTKSLKDFTIASFLQHEGETTDLFLRFSTVAGEQGSSDMIRDPRGFAMKFYTKEGNYDVVGNNTPVFFLRDPLKFPDFIHSQKRCPMRNVTNPDAVWDFWSQNPQSLHQITILFSDRGIPKSFRHMNGYGSHTFSFWNTKGERFWFKWHFKTNQGVQCLTNEEAGEIVKHRPWAAQEDLFDHIERGDYPSWTAHVQIMPEKEAEKSPWTFDLTKVWSHKDYPLIEVGQLELNRNPDNYFAEVEQSALSPSNFVPGIGPSPDKMLQARLFAYPDAHRYRLGTNIIMRWMSIDLVQDLLIPINGMDKCAPTKREKRITAHTTIQLLMVKHIQAVMLHTRSPQLGFHRHHWIDLIIVTVMMTTANQPTCLRSWMVLRKGSWS